MRIDATISFEIKDAIDGKSIEAHITDVVSGSVADVIANAFRNGWWSGPNAIGTFYPASRLYSAHVTYRAHCGHAECTEPYSEESDSYAELASTPREHTHVLPAPPKEKKDQPAKKSGRRR